jgi:hypothetical protein
MSKRLLLLVLCLYSCSFRYTKYKDYSQLIVGFGFHTTSIKETVHTHVGLGDSLIFNLSRDTLNRKRTAHDKD